MQLGDRGSNLTEEELETHTISAWKQAKLFLNRQANEHRSEFPSQLVQVTIFNIHHDYVSYQFQLALLLKEVW